MKRFNYRLHSSFSELRCPVKHKLEYLVLSSSSLMYLRMWEFH